jgi:hypothetical protein
MQRPCRLAGPLAHPATWPSPACCTSLTPPPCTSSPRRPEFFYTSVSIFFHNVLRLNEMLVTGRVDAVSVQQRSKEALS